VTRPEYAAAGLVGILPPQSNTTVEAELSVLLPPEVGTIVSRLVCHEQDARARLVGYFRNVDQALRGFDAARPDVVLFACTGSSYLVGLAEEKENFSTLGIISAAQAVLDALDALGARRIALLSPYPAWLTEACIAFWRLHGREITDVQSTAGERSDTRRIYALGSADALRALESLNTAHADAVLISGTGMPSLGAIARAELGVPMLSSNLCLAWAATRQLKGLPLDRASLQTWLARTAPWRASLATRFPSSTGRIA
jgi:maleate isomerase